MNSFIRELENLNKDSNNRFLWDYYNSFNNYPYTKFLNKPKVFIKQFMKKSGKMIDGMHQFGFNLLELKDIKLDRAKHIVSIYFLGIYVYEKSNILNKILDETFKAIKESFTDKLLTKTKLDFYYFWFLICFYHDLGYIVEENGMVKDYITRKQMIDTIQNLFNDIKMNDYPSDYYSEEVILNYLHFRNYKDHGIIGGIKYYIDRSIEYERKRKVSKEKTFIDENNLIWSDEIVENIHKPIARSIILHNIWFCKKGTSNEKHYKKHGLNDLIICLPPITTQHIFSYFLQLMDTIDPSKQKTELKDIVINVNNCIIEINSRKPNDIFWLKLKANYKEANIKLEIPEN